MLAALRGAHEEKHRRRGRNPKLCMEDRLLAAPRFLKRFKIIAERYRNLRKRFGLRVNLLAGICNFDLLA